MLSRSIEDILRDTDSEVEDDEETKKKKNQKPAKSKKSGSNTWLKEGGDEEDIIDFLDPSVAKKVLGKRLKLPGNFEDSLVVLTNICGVSCCSLQLPSLKMGLRSLKSRHQSNTISKWLLMADSSSLRRRVMMRKGQRVCHLINVILCLISSSP